MRPHRFQELAVAARLARGLQCPYGRANFLSAQWRIVLDNSAVSVTVCIRHPLQTKSAMLRATPPSASKVRWRDMRCVRCGRLLQRVEENALRPGKRLEIKCGHCKVVNYLVGMELNAPVTGRATEAPSRRN